MAAETVFYFDLASPYAYLASTRIEASLGPDVRWQPVLVGALHRHFRRVSWGATPELRSAGVAEIESRARDYGLPAIVWPAPYPANSLIAMRAAIWADRQGSGRAFAQAAFAAAFQQGIDLTPRSAVLEVAERLRLDAADLDSALGDGGLKQALRDANDRAIAEGVYGVPTFDAGGLLWWGDQQLPAAAAALGGRPSA
jgi:2-hydroxychromene-2-carboxylate isomerase